MRRAGFVLPLLMLVIAGTVHAQTLTIYAAASLTNAVTALAERYQASHPTVQIQTSFASSATLAKHIAAGAPADVFISADQAWMDELTKQNRIVTNSRTQLLVNRLVLISPNSNPLHLSMNKSSKLSQRMTGRLCMGNPDSVPAGRYGKQALQWMGWYQGVQSRIVPTEDVRSALAFVERGDCQAGIVYQTDALISDKVKTVGVFPIGSHDPIIYPIAAIRSADDSSAKAALQLIRYAQDPAQQSLWTRFGFAQLGPQFTLASTP
jgi:molybdate transport system substrate-binding protein